MQLPKLSDAVYRLWSQVQFSGGNWDRAEWFPWEVALIVQYWALFGFLDQQLFGSAILMTLLTTILGPILNVILTDKKGSLKELEKGVG